MKTTQDETRDRRHLCQTELICGQGVLAWPRAKVSTRIPPLLRENKGVKQFQLLYSREKSVRVQFRGKYTFLLHSLLHSYYILKN